MVYFQLEKAFTNPRDIEWAVNEGQIFLLQVTEWIR